MDWDNVEITAYGFLELTPDQFFNLTPREFSLMYEGFKLRERRKAHYVQWLLSPHVRKVPKLTDVLGFGDDKTPKHVARKIQDDTLAELERELLN